MYIAMYIERQGHSCGASNTHDTPSFLGIIPILDYLSLQEGTQ